MDNNRPNGLEEFGSALEDLGGAMSSCGCLLTLFVTIPIILFILMLL